MPPYERDGRFPVTVGSIHKSLRKYKNETGPTGDPAGPVNIYGKLT